MGNEINAKAFFDEILKEIKNDKNIKNKELIIKSLENKTLDKYFEDCSDTKAIIPILQKVNEYFLKNCEIHIGEDVIVPTETEIYFANNYFYDGMCHKNDLQKKNFGHLYFHRYYKKEKNDTENTIIWTKTTRGGVDVCLSDSETYYLSVLIRKCIRKNENYKIAPKSPRKICDEILKNKIKNGGYLKKLEENIVIFESNINKDKKTENNKRICGKQTFYDLNCKVKI